MVWSVMKVEGGAAACTAAGVLLGCCWGWELGMHHIPSTYARGRPCCRAGGAARRRVGRKRLLSTPNPPGVVALKAGVLVEVVAPVKAPGRRGCMQWATG